VADFDDIDTARAEIERLRGLLRLTEAALEDALQRLREVEKPSCPEPSPH
jgi:hypothetical protein